MAKQRAKRASRANPREERQPRRNQSHVRTIEPPKKKLKDQVDIIPRSANQEDLVCHLEDSKKHIVFAVGPAGCGKTLLSTMAAIKALKENKIEKIVITRPNVAVDDNDIGYLPGDILKKLTPWMMPILDVFAEYYTQKEIAFMLEENIIEMVPLAFIRGRTFKNAILLFDEAQNSTPTSMLSVLTRIGEGSKMIVTGDVRQGDRGLDNGLSDVINRLSKKNSSRIALVNFGDKDVERHPVIIDVLEMYQDLEIPKSRRK